MAQIAKIRNYIIYCDIDREKPYYNAYVIKKRTYSAVDFRWHTKTVEKYADLKSCLLYIADEINE